MDTRNQEPSNQENTEEKQAESERYEDRVDNAILSVMGSSEEES